MSVCAHKSCLISALRGLRNGLYYGGRVRLMHSIVMMILFHNGSLKEKIQKILENTLEHARKLGSFVFLYKLLVCMLNKLRKKQQPIHSLISGSVAGYIVFRKKTSINMQIVLYLLSRIIIGICELLVKQGKLPNYTVYPYLASGVWAIVMFLYELDGNQLQYSLKSSMDYLYRDSDVLITSYWQLLPFDLSKYLTYHK